MSVEDRIVQQRVQQIAEVTQGITPSVAADLDCGFVPGACIGLEAKRKARGEIQRGLAPMLSALAQLSERADSYYLVLIILTEFLSHSHKLRKNWETMRNEQWYC